jgi:hypothetical protein
MQPRRSRSGARCSNVSGERKYGSQYFDTSITTSVFLGGLSFIAAIILTFMFYAWWMILALVVGSGVVAVVLRGLMDTKAVYGGYFGAAFVAFFLFLKYGLGR